MRGELLVASESWVGQRRRDAEAVGPVLRAIAEFFSPAGQPADGIERLGRHPLLSAEGFDTLGPTSLGLTLGGTPIVVKCLPPLGRWGPFPRWERSRARRAHRFGHILRAQAIATPRVLGFLEGTRQPSAGSSWLVTERLLARSLSSILAEDLETTRRRDHLRAVAGTLRRLHGAGLDHGDLHPGNVLVEGHEAVLIDLESMRSVFVPWSPVQNLERLSRDLERFHLGPRDCAVFLGAYVGSRPDAAPRRRALVHAINRERRRRKHRRED